MTVVDGPSVVYYGVDWGSQNPYDILDLSKTRLQYSEWMGVIVTKITFCKTYRLKVQL